MSTGSVDLVSEEDLMDEDFMDDDDLLDDEEWENPTRYISPEDREIIWRKGFDALEAGDRETGRALLAQLPIRPSWAKYIFETQGKEFCEAYFNLYDANQEFGEGWMDG